MPQEGDLTEGTGSGEFKDLLESVFSDPFEVNQRSAGRWQFNITGGEHAGYVVVIEGNELTGDGESPSHGHIGAIIVRDGDTIEGRATELNLSYADFAHVFDEHTDPPGDDLRGDDLPGDHTPDDPGTDDPTSDDHHDHHEPDHPQFNLDRLRDLLKTPFEVTERSDGEWTYAITDGKFAGFSIIVTGTEFTGDGYAPDAGHITGIAVMHGDEVVGERTGLDLPIEELRNKFQHDDGEHLRGGSHDDDMQGGKGDDHFEGGRGDDTVMGGDGRDNLHGGQGDDSMDGGAGRDRLGGNGGDDDLCGGAGSDAIRGGAGDDTLTGGAGKDKMFGGGGADHFVFLLATDSRAGDSRDLILDFKQGHDVIDLSAIDANGDATDGDSAFAFVGTSAFSGVAGELRASGIGHGHHGATLIEADIDGDGTADFQIGLAGQKHLTAADFIL